MALGLLMEELRFSIITFGEQSAMTISMLWMRKSCVICWDILGNSYISLVTILFIVDAENFLLGLANTGKTNLIFQPLSYP